MGFTQEDIDKAKAEDAIGNWFGANYISGVTPEQDAEAKNTMVTLLKKYKTRDELEKNPEDWAKYQEAMIIRFSYSQDTMETAFKEQKDLIRRKNALSDFFESNLDILFALPVWARRNIRVYTDIGKLRGTEYLWDIVANSDKPEEVILQIANAIYNRTGYMGQGDIGVLENGPVIFIHPKPDCGGNWTSYVEYKERIKPPTNSGGCCGGTC